MSEYERGLIPDMKSFPIVKDIFLKFLKQKNNVGEIESAFIYGSVFRGDYNISSDLDALIISDESSIESLDIDISNLKKLIFNYFNIEIEDNPVEKELAQDGFHTLIPSFSQHLKNVVKNGGGTFISENPFDIINGHPENVIESAKNSLVYKLNKFRKKSTNRHEEKDRLSIIKNILQEPYHIARLYL